MLLAIGIVEAAMDSRRDDPGKYLVIGARCVYMSSPPPLAKTLAVIVLLIDVLWSIPTLVHLVFKPSELGLCAPVVTDAGYVRRG